MSDDAPYNVVVIGAGTAGLVVAAATAGLGGRVALIERALMGGDCLNFGCVPSKALIASARAVDRIRHADRYGLDATEPAFAFEKVIARLRARRASIAPHDSQERFESLGVEVFRGEASFASPHEVVVGDRRLRARNFVIASGTRPAIPKIDGLNDVPFFTNETIFDKLDQRPASMLILGGGPIGCELAQAFARLGVKVTLVQSASRLLTKEDADISTFVRRVLEADGVECLLAAKATRVRQDAGEIVLTVERDGNPSEHRAATFLVAAGRAPNVESLNLSAAGVRRGKHGVEVNAQLQTSQPHIYAAGDIAGPFPFTHMADYQARIVARNILVPLPWLRQKADYSAVPWCTYLDPEVARVGLNEEQAKERGIAYDLHTTPIANLDRAVLEDETAGLVKVLTARGSDRILGVTLVAAHAGDLIHEFVLAMACGIGLGKISGTIHAYPTFAELARKTGDAYQKTRLTPFAKKLFHWLYERARRL
jgi:pyruvate/2-oxoglutarate dehydrogenase complex dihydrolipoamide dehydrogenase (E3) component